MQNISYSRAGIALFIAASCGLMLGIVGELIPYQAFIAFGLLMGVYFGMANTETSIAESLKPTIPYLLILLIPVSSLSVFDSLMIRAYLPATCIMIVCVFAAFGILQIFVTPMEDEQNKLPSLDIADAIEKPYLRWLAFLVPLILSQLVLAYNRGLFLLVDFFLTTVYDLIASITIVVVARSLVNHRTVFDKGLGAAIGTIFLTLTIAPVLAEPALRSALEFVGQEDLTLHNMIMRYGVRASGLVCLFYFLFAILKEQTANNRWVLCAKVAIVIGLFQLTNHLISQPVKAIYYSVHELIAPYPN